MVRALTSHQCCPGSIPRVGVTCGVSLFVAYSAPGAFSNVLRCSPIHNKQTNNLRFEKSCLSLFDFYAVSTVNALELEIHLQ